MRLIDYTDAVHAHLTKLNFSNLIKQYNPPVEEITLFLLQYVLSGYHDKKTPQQTAEQIIIDFLAAAQVAKSTINPSTAYLN